MHVNIPLAYNRSKQASSACIFLPGVDKATSHVYSANKWNPFNSVHVYVSLAFFALIAVLTKSIVCMHKHTEWHCYCFQYVQMSFFFFLAMLGFLNLSAVFILPKPKQIKTTAELILFFHFVARIYSKSQFFHGSPLQCLSLFMSLQTALISHLLPPVWQCHSNHC